MSLRSLRIAPRATLCFAAISVFVIVLGVFAFLQLREMRGTETDIEEKWLASIQAADEIQIALLEARVESIRLLATNDPEVIAKASAEIRRNRDVMNERTRFYKENLIADASERASFETAARLMTQFLDGLERIIALVQSDPQAAVAYANGEQREHATAYQAKLTELRIFNAQGAAQAGRHATGIYEQSLTIMSVIVAAALLCTLLLAWRLTRSIVGPIQETLDVAKTIAKGELTHEVPIAGNDEAAGLMQAMAQMQASLRETIRGITLSSAELSNAATQMNAITDSSSRTVQQQNSEIDQAATAVTQMSAAVEEVARNANSTSESARQSSAAAQTGSDKVDQTLKSMQVLTKQVEASSAQVQTLASSAQDIAQVLGVIRGIAEQTNLLALNAAIEAARAGEQGRGFAVVADEVRALAHRTQTSTEEIDKMIATIQDGSRIAVDSMQASTDQAHATFGIAQSAGTALVEILETVKLIEERNLQIATASEEQAHVAREVDRNLVSIRDLAANTGDATSRTLEASNALSGLAGGLQKLVSRFKIAG